MPEDKVSKYIRPDIVEHAKVLTCGVSRDYRQELLREVLETPLQDIIGLDVDYVCQHSNFNSKKTK
jgi:hypothetical protein